MVLNDKPCLHWQHFMVKMPVTCNSHYCTYLGHLGWHDTNRNNPICAMSPKVSKASTVTRLLCVAGTNSFANKCGAGVIRRPPTGRQANWSIANWSTGLWIQPTGRKCQLVDTANWPTGQAGVNSSTPTGRQGTTNAANVNDPILFKELEFSTVFLISICYYQKF